MNDFTLLKRMPWRYGLVVFFAVAAMGPVKAQIAQIKQAVEGTPPAAATASEKPEDASKRLEQWQKEAREMLGRIDGSVANAVVPEGITAAEVNERRRDLEQLVLITTIALKDMTAGDQAAKALERARTEDAGWITFKETPPYSILLLDDLLGEQSAVLAKLETTESAQANMKSLLANAIAELKAAEDRSNAAISSVQNASENQADAAVWRLDASRARVRTHAVRAAYFQSTIEANQQRLAAIRSELALVERKIAVVRPKVVFSDEDLAKVEKTTTERSKVLEKEIASVAKRLQTAMANRAKAQSALDVLLAENAEVQALDTLDIARFRLEVSEGRVESLQSVSQSLEGLVMMENFMLEAYRERRNLMQTSDPAERVKSLESIHNLIERYLTWLNVISNEIATCGADLSKIESRATSITADDTRFGILNEQRAACSEKLTLLQRVQQVATSHHAILHRWAAEFTPKPDDSSWLQKLRDSARYGMGWVKKIWNYEVMSFEDKIEVDGQTITGKLPVTLGMLLRALLFFVIGYAVASSVASRIQRVIITRGHIAEAQAKTLRNWAMIVVGVGLALGTLSFLKIPLTVFAFFGGALAIGLGFGMQTLIKNFISGIIVLAERQIRVGDILDVDGIVGTVIEVNTRSSIIRSPDEVETMIPNSMFLENRVTNWTLSSSKMRRSLRVGVAYGSDPRAVMDILTECAGRHGLICKNPPPFAVFEDFGESALIFVLYFWIELVNGTNAIVVASDLRLMIEKRIAEVGISLPFPQRDIHLVSQQPIQVQMTPKSE